LNLPLRYEGWFDVRSTATDIAIGSLISTRRSSIISSMSAVTTTHYHHYHILNQALL